MVDVTLSITGANGDTITFDDDTFVLTRGVKGFGVPSATLRIQESAGDGGVFRYSKRGVREIDLPVVIFGTDRNDLWTKTRRLSNLLRNTAGPATLTASFSDGTAYKIDVYYAGGADATYGADSNDTFVRWVLTLQAPTPFWSSLSASTFTVTQANTGRGMLPKLSSLKLTSNSAIGAVTVTNNEGDVPSYPIFTVYGPLTTLSVSNGSQGFTYTAPIAVGEVITIDAANGTVVDATGANKYANLGTAPKFFTIPTGTTTINILGDGATGASQISCTYYPRREVLH